MGKFCEQLLEIGVVSGQHSTKFALRPLRIGGASSLATGSGVRE